MPLSFSRASHSYFTVVARLLEQAQNGLTKSEIEQLVSSHGFYDSTFHLLPSLFSGEWNLLDKKDNIYYSKLSDKIKRPLTTLEKSWIKALLDDPRIRLFLDENQLTELSETLGDVPPLFLQQDFHIYDRHLDGDDFSNPAYIARFRTILSTLKEQKPLFIEYDNTKGERTKRQYHPHKICYSARDNKFRLLCAAFHQRQNKLQRITLNLARITSVQVSKSRFDITADLDTLFQEAVCAEPVVLEISRERNALERCMLQFASFERHTEYDRECDIYICRIWFDLADEIELLIRILSFGPVIKVLGPDGFLQKVKERIERQLVFIR